MERIKALLDALAPWDAVVATICTGLFTIAGVFITVIFNARADKCRVAAERAQWSMSYVSVRASSGKTKCEPRSNLALEETIGLV